MTERDDLPITITRTPRGQVITSPVVPHWTSPPCRTVHDLAKAIAQAWLRRDLNLYHELKGPEPEASITSLPRTAGNNEVYAGFRRTHDIADWKPLPNGCWQSPGGNIRLPGTDMVNKIIAKRKRFGLSSSYEEAVERGEILTTPARTALF